MGEHMFLGHSRLAQSARNIPVSPRTNQLTLPSNLQETLRGVQQSIEQYSDDSNIGNSGSPPPPSSHIQVSPNRPPNRNVDQFFDELKIDFNFDSI